MQQHVSVARTTGWLYLALAVTGALSYLLVRQQLFAADDPAATLAGLLEREGLARFGLGLELGVVLSQALAALWFWRLFRPVHEFAAAAVAAFGIMNAVGILSSVAFLASGLQASSDPGLAVAGGSAATVQLMYVISENLWGVGGLFFGLWLIPMGWLVLHSGWMPRLLGYILIAGGVGYVLSTFLGYLITSAGAEALVYLATVGEFWMIGYLLVVGVRRAPASTTGVTGVGALV